MLLLVKWTFRRECTCLDITGEGAKNIPESLIIGEAMKMVDTISTENGKLLPISQGSMQSSSTAIHFKVIFRTNEDCTNFLKKVHATN